MHTYQGESCRIHYNSDLSGEIIIAKGDVDVSVDLQDILWFVMEQALDYNETAPLEALITAEISKITAISIETTKINDGIRKTDVMTIRGEKNGETE